jgi:CubicO group peptidase (beta-lactamase class C family)
MNLSKSKMNGSIKLVTALLLAGACHPQPKKESALVPQQLDSLFAAVPDFSGAVLVAENGRPIYHKAFGYVNYETKVPVDTTSIFELASVSKQFTAMLIMMLKEAGKLDYDDPVDRYLPGIPYPGMTVRNLLQHTSGLPEYETLMTEHWDKSKVASNSDILEYLSRYHPPRLFEPGKEYRYNNTGYVLLGSIIEKVSGRDYVALCHDRIFAPLGMTSTDLRTPAQKRAIANFALGHIFVPAKNRYVRADSFPETNYVFYLGNRRGPGRISSTTSDLLKWDQGLYTDKLVKRETLREAFTASGIPGPYEYDGYGFGWMLDHDALGHKIRHSGDNPGYRTHILRYIDAHKTIIILCNNQYPGYKNILKGMETLLLREPPAAGQ